MAFSHGQVSDARCTGSSSDSRRSLFAAPAYSPQGLPQRKMLGLGVRRQPRGVGGQKSERRIRIFAVLGQIEVHAADQVPRRVPALQEFLYPAFRLRQFDAECGVQFLPEGAKDLRASDTPRQSWEAPPGPAGPTPRRAAPGRALSAASHRYPGGCRGRSRTMRRILSSRRRQEEARLRLQPLRVGEGHGPIRARRHSAGVEQARDRGAARQELRLTRGGRAETGLGQERLNPCRGVYQLDGAPVLRQVSFAIAANVLGLARS